MAEKTIRMETGVVPPKAAQRLRIRELAERHVGETALEPPFEDSRLMAMAETLLIDNNFPIAWIKFAAIMISNAASRNRVAAIPFDRRILFLPKCMRNAQSCEAQLDAFGLLCKNCGNCDVGAIQSKAEALGYTVLVAEGATLVTRMLMKGHLDAVIGVSCISVLEKAFPHLSAGEIPALALPLLTEGCDDTGCDVGWLHEMLELERKPEEGVKLDGLRRQVDTWFEPARLERTLTSSGTHTEKVGLKWLARGGKRWRPLLAASTFQALTGIMPDGHQGIEKLAVAVECFHKASLIHDDIEDDDDVRYGLPTLHMEHGMPFAINAGDYLIGEGYRLIGECNSAAEDVVRMLMAAATGHRELSLGQGEELWWTHTPGPISVGQVLDIFRLKTSPAFDVAIKLGTICGGGDEALCQILDVFGDNLGIAYQIQDDLDDFFNAPDQDDIDAMRPSLLLALCYIKCGDDLRERMEAAWKIHRSFRGLSEDLRQEIDMLGIPETAVSMLDEYRQLALDALETIQAPALKGLLVTLTDSILPRRP